MTLYPTKSTRAYYAGKHILYPICTAKHILYQRPNLQNNPNPWTEMTMFGGACTLGRSPRDAHHLARGTICTGRTQTPDDRTKPIASVERRRVSKCRAQSLGNHP